MESEKIITTCFADELAANAHDTVRLRKLKDELKEGPMYVHTRRFFENEIQKQIDKNEAGNEEGLVQ